MKIKYIVIWGIMLAACFSVVSAAAEKVTNVFGESIYEKECDFGKCVFFVEKCNVDELGDCKYFEEVYVYDIKTNEITKITTTKNHKRDLDFNEEIIVWIEYGDPEHDWIRHMYMYNFKTNETIKLTNTGDNMIEPNIIGNYIVWEGYEFESWELFRYKYKEDAKENATTIANETITINAPKYIEEGHEILLFPIIASIFMMICCVCGIIIGVRDIRKMN